MWVDKTCNGSSVNDSIYVTITFTSYTDLSTLTIS